MMQKFEEDKLIIIIKYSNLSAILFIFNSLFIKN